MVILILPPLVSTAQGAFFELGACSSAQEVYYSPQLRGCWGRCGSLQGQAKLASQLPRPQSSDAHTAMMPASKRRPLHLTSVALLMCEHRQKRSTMLCSCTSPLPALWDLDDGHTLVGVSLVSRQLHPVPSCSKMSCGGTSTSIFVCMVELICRVCLRVWCP